MAHRKKVTVVIDGESLTHIHGVIHDYATLCGLDGSDEKVGQSIAETTKDAKVNCQHCIAIWAEARSWKPSDFDQKQNRI